MNRQWLRLALALVGTLVAGSVWAGDDSRASQRPTVATGRFTLTVRERRADVEAITAAVGERFGGTRLVERRRLLARGGAKLALVFEVPRAQKAVKSDVLEKFLKKLCKKFAGDAMEVKRKWAKGKPINLPIFESDWSGRTVHEGPALTRISAKAANARSTGAGQVVAVLDGGFDLGHEFLAQNLVAADYDALDDDDDPQDLGNGINDDASFEPAGDVRTDRIVGHGTFVSSLILAAAPNARILPIRVLNDEGWGTELSVASGVTYAVEHGARVINMSLVLPNASSIVKDAVRAAVDAGVVIVTAAGTTDDGWQTDQYLNRRSICVGSTDDRDVIAEWCTSGKQVHVFAPGVEMRGALGARGPRAYGRWSGVSFSVPLLSAGAALLRQTHPADWSAMQVRDRLATNVDPAYHAVNSPVWGRGRVDLDQAVPSK